MATLLADAALHKVAEGKTKEIWQLTREPSMCEVRSKDLMSAGDGRRRDELLGKAQLSNRTTCSVFRLLQGHAVPLSFMQCLGGVSFLASLCDMIPLEVVIRRRARGSYFKRHPYAQKDESFDPPLVEFYLKTSGKEWRGKALPCDDPILQEEGDDFVAYRPDQAVTDATRAPILPPLQPWDFSVRAEQVEDIRGMAVEVFTIIEKAFAAEGGTLIDMKLEFGLTMKDRKLVVADVIDNDSWRVEFEGKDLSKQGYRDGDDLGTTLENYRFVAEVTDRFVFRPS